VSIILLTTCNIKGSAATKFYPDFNNLKVARVIEVIDGEVLKVLYGDTYSQSNMEIVKLIGVNTEGNRDAFEYISNYYLGKAVYVMPERNNTNLPKTNGWRNVYILKDAAQTLNEILLKNGLAKVDKGYYLSDSYETLLAAEKSAIVTAQGIWNGSYESNYFEKGPKVNLNTSSINNLIGILEDTTYVMASRILEYRAGNPFNTIEEIKNVDESFNSKWYAKNKKYLTVVTNITLAEESELLSLINYSYTNNDKVVQNILNYRIFNEISTLDTLKNIDGMTTTIIDRSKEFITFENVADYENPVSIAKININTASLEEMKKYSGLYEVYAKSIFDASVFYKYKFRNLQELANTPVYLTDMDTRRIADNASVYTDINTANKIELISLFGRTNHTSAAKEAFADKIIKNRPFNNITDLTKSIGDVTNYFKDCVYFTQRTNNIININAMEKEDIVKMFNLTSYIKTSVLNNKDIYRNISELPFKIQEYDSSKISLYTNINTATKAELLTLNKYITSEMADTIIYLRNEEQFASNDDLLEALSEYKNGAMIFSKISGYVCYK
jgi:DNA uptake protein ComE-like DNA-binding protein